jgi:hypothetical protein
METGVPKCWSGRISNGEAVKAPIPKAATACRPAVLAATIAVLAVGAQAADPKVPPAVETGNRVPVAIITRGFDYTRPDIARLLARDGEGEVIAWDVTGEDRFPYDAGGDTALISEIAAHIGKDASISLLAVKADPDDPVSMAKALAFIARTPARSTIVPMWSSQRRNWEPFEKAARHFNKLRIVVRSCPDLPADGPDAVYPRDLELPNVTLSSDPAATVETLVAGLPCRRP